MGILSDAELPLELGRERIDPDVFDRLIFAMQGIELAATLGVAEILPAGGFVASAGEARLLDKGFEQDGPLGVTCLPVLGQAFADQGQDARSQILAADPRQDEESGIVHDEVQVALSLL